MNWQILIPAGVIIIAIIVYAIIRNNKDIKELERKINAGDPNGKEEDSDLEES